MIGLQTKTTDAPTHFLISAIPKFGKPHKKTFCAFCCFGCFGHPRVVRSGVTGPLRLDELETCERNTRE